MWFLFLILALITELHKNFLEVRFHNINVFISSKINKQYKN